MPQTVWVVAYDVGDDGRRERLATALSAYGPRVQLSVFECLIPTPTAGRALRKTMRELIDVEEDQIRIYVLSSDDPSRTLILGARMLEERQDYWIV